MEYRQGVTVLILSVCAWISVEANCAFATSGKSGNRAGVFQATVGCILGGNSGSSSSSFESFDFLFTFFFKKRERHLALYCNQTKVSELVGKLTSFSKEVPFLANGPSFCDLTMIQMRPRCCCFRSVLRHQVISTLLILHQNGQTISLSGQFSFDQKLKK